MIGLPAENTAEMNKLTISNSFDKNLTRSDEKWVLSASIIDEEHYHHDELREGLS